MLGLSHPPSNTQSSIFYSSYILYSSTLRDSIQVYNLLINAGRICPENVKNGFFLKNEKKEAIFPQPGIVHAKKAGDVWKSIRQKTAALKLIFAFLKLHAGALKTPQVLTSRESVSFAHPAMLFRTGRLHSRRETA